MTEYDLYILKTDGEFKRLIPPLSSDERKQLEENIIDNGCLQPICVWNKTILDGHSRYEICMRQKIPFKVAHIFLKNKEEAIAWICANQLGRDNITEEARRYLIGKRYEVEKCIGAHNAVRVNQYMRKESEPRILSEEPFGKTIGGTSGRLGKVYNISPATVDKYGVYARAIDSLAEVEPTLAIKILAGQVKISQERAVELSRLLPLDIQRISTDLLEESVGYLGVYNTTTKRKASKSYFPPIRADSVKKMPVYDPDAGVISLALTIPSWISSIHRTHSSAKIVEVSSDVRHRLELELSRLRSVVDVMLLVIREED